MLSLEAFYRRRGQLRPVIKTWLHVESIPGDKTKHPNNVTVSDVVGDRTNCYNCQYLFIFCIFYLSV